MGCTIRDATLDDADVIAALLGELGYPSTAQVAAGHIARFSAVPGSTMQLAVLTAGEAVGIDGGSGGGAVGAVVGLIATHLVPRMDEDCFACRITDLVVAAAARRQGVGSALLAAAEEVARAAGALRLDLASGTWRADAHAFYSAHGFETHAAAFAKRLA